MSKQHYFKQVARDATDRGRGERRHRFGSLALAVAIVLALATILTGCNSAASDESPGEPANSSDSSQSATSPTPTPTPSPTGYVPATAEGPAQNVPVPEKPALANEMTNEGWQAFVYYFFDQMNYLVETNDFRGVQNYTTGSCQLCMDEMSVANTMENHGQWRAGGKFTVTDTGTDGAPNQDDYIGGLLQLSRTDATPYDNDRSYSLRSGIEPSTWYVTLGKGETGWVVISINKIEQR